MTPEMDDTLTIMPPVALRCGAAARAHRYAPFTLTSRVMSQISSVNASMSVIGTQRVIPALFTRISRRPNLSTV